MQKIAFFFLFLISFSVNAAEFVIPKQTIVGAEEPIALGELVDLSLSPIKEKPQHYHSSSYNWKVIELPSGKEKKVRVVDDGIFFGSGIEAKRLKVFVSVTHLYIAKNGDKIEEIAAKNVFLTADVVIGTTPPPTPPGPDPPVPTPPDVEPSFPQGKFGLSAFSYNAAKSQVPAGANRAKAAKALAGAFRSVASKIAAGAVKSAEEALKNAAEANNAALKPFGTSDWETFSDSLQDQLYALYKDGKVKTLEDWSAAFNEIALGLEAVK